MTTQPRRIKLSTVKRSQLDIGDVIDITWPGPWGNPFIPKHPNGLGWGTVRGAEHAVQLFTRWLYLDHDLVAHERDRHAWILEHLDDLRGKTLACWCDLDTPCHGAVLLIAANSTTFANRHDHLEKPQEGKVDARTPMAALLRIAAERKKGTPA